MHDLRDRLSSTGVRQRETSMLSWEGTPIQGVGAIVEKITVCCLHYDHEVGAYGTTDLAFPKGSTQGYYARCAAIFTYYS